MTEAALVGQRATSTEVSVLACLRTGEPPPRTRYTVTVADTGTGIGTEVPVQGWELLHPARWSRRRLVERLKGKQPVELCFAKLTIGGLAPGTSHTLDLVDSETGETEATATVRTLADDPSGRVGIVFGSCHALQPDQPRLQREIASFLTTAYERFEADGGCDGALNLWLGDQVYVDADIAKNLWGTDPHEVILGYYARAWGLDSTEIPSLPDSTETQSGLAAMMQRSSNWYLADDHEFWNDYPRASVTLPYHTSKRVITHLYRYARKGGALPHPYDQGAWGHTAGAAFMVFQTPDPTPHYAFGRSTNPELVQHIDTCGVRIVLVDTRWHRTMSKTRNPEAGFMTEAALDRMVDLVQFDGPVVIGLARPIIGHVPHEGWLTEGWEAGPENFRRQYSELWAVIAERAKRGPTLLIAGDVHRHAAKLTSDGRLAELTCPPLALLPSLRPGAGSLRARAISSIMGLKGKLVRLRRRPPTTDRTHLVPDRRRVPQRWARSEGTDLLEPPPLGGTWEGLTRLTVETSESAGTNVTCDYAMREVVTGRETTQQVSLHWDGDRWREGRAAPGHAEIAVVAD